MIRACAARMAGLCPGASGARRDCEVGSVLAGLALLAAAAVVAVRGAALGTFPIDGASYVATAISLGETGALRVPWGSGIDTKFFPGLSVVLALRQSKLGLPWGCL